MGCPLKSKYIKRYMETVSPKALFPPLFQSPFASVVTCTLRFVATSFQRSSGARSRLIVNHGTLYLSNMKQITFNAQHATEVIYIYSF